MINKFSLAKALFDKADEVSTDNSLLLIPNGEAFEPDPNGTYIQEMVLYGDDDSIGISDSSSDIQLGIYQINVNTPKAMEGGKWRCLEIADIYQTEFFKGLQLTFNSQMVRIKNSSIERMTSDDTHFTHILSITFSVIN